MGTADRSTNCKAMYSKRLREFNVSPNAEISQLSVTKAKVKKTTIKQKNSISEMKRLAGYVAKFGGYIYIYSKVTAYTSINLARRWL